MTPPSGVTRLLLVCHASTPATTRAAFPGDEPLDERGLRRAARLAREFGPGPAACPAELRCVQTVAALGLRAERDPLLADCDYGRWRGMTLDQVGAAEPEALASWLGDPAVAPHGGEPIVALLARVSGWLAVRAPGRAVAVTHPAVIRAAVVHALGAPAQAFWRVDVAPLARVALTGRGGRWQLSYPPMTTHAAQTAQTAQTTQGDPDGA